MSFQKAQSLSRLDLRGDFDLKKIEQEPTLLKKGIAFVMEVIDSFNATEISGVSSRMAFVGLFALMPTLLFIVSLCELIIPDFKNLILTFLQYGLPQTSFTYLSNELTLLLNYLNRLRYFMFFLSMFLGTLDSYTILSGLNQSYGFGAYKKRRYAWIKGLMLLIGLVVIMAILTGGILLTVYTSDFVRTEILHASSSPLAGTSFYIGAGFIVGVFVILLLLYVFTPQVRISFRDAFPGAVFSTFMLVVVFQIYVRILNNSLNYLIVYGSMSGLFLLLVTLYFLSFILCLGCKVNVLFASRKKAL